MKSPRKAWKIVLLVLVVILVGASLFLGSIVKTAVERVGPSIVGAPITLSFARFEFLRGAVHLRGFVLGNPPGYKTDHAISVGKILVNLDMSSIFSKTLVIENILISEPDITYEMGLGNSNIGTIMDHLKGGEKKKEEEEKEKAEEPEKESGRKVVINDLLIEKGSVHISAKLTGGVAAPIPLPPIHLKDIGKESGGTSVADVVKKVFGSIFEAVGSVAVGSVKAVGEGAEKVGGAVVDGASKVIGGVGDLLGGEKDK